MTADTLTRWLEQLDALDGRVSDLMGAKPGDEAPLLDYGAALEGLRESIQQARIDALRAELPKP